MTRREFANAAKILRSTRREFENAAKILRSIDFNELVEAGAMKETDVADKWQEFRRRPVEYLIMADDTIAARIWSIVERRL